MFERFGARREKGCGCKPTIDIDPPKAVRDRAYDRVASLRREVKGVSVPMETRSIASAANPASLLAHELSGNRDRFVGGAGGSDRVADRAVETAEGAYLDHLEDTLRSRSSLMDRAQRTLATELRERAILMSPPETVDERSDLGWEVAAEPAYLSIAPRESGPPPLATRNVNILAVPYGDAANSVAGAVDAAGGGTVSLGTAARTLRALEDEETVAPSRERRLRRAIEDSLDTTAGVYRSRLRSSVGSQDAERAVSAAFERFDSLSQRALAIADGEMAAAIAGQVSGDVDARERDRLRMELRETPRALRERSGVRIDESLVETARNDATPGQPMTETAKAAGETVGTQAWERATGRTPGSIPAGLPLVPVPGYWYATANAWSVSVPGSYDRFVVRAPWGHPAEHRMGPSNTSGPTNGWNSTWSGTTGQSVSGTIARSM